MLSCENVNKFLARREKWRNIHQLFPVVKALGGHNSVTRGKNLLFVIPEKFLQNIKILPKKEGGEKKKSATTHYGYEDACILEQFSGYE